jgi:hypothetical protein
MVANYKRKGKKNDMLSTFVLFKNYPQDTTVATVSIKKMDFFFHIWICKAEKQFDLKGA